MSTYATLDGEILAAIRSGKHPLYARNVHVEAKRIADQMVRQEHRVIDGRLQAMRKAGKIVAYRKAISGWVLAPVRPEEKP